MPKLTAAFTSPPTPAPAPAQTRIPVGTHLVGKSKLWQKRFPTILGLAVLVIGLVAGTLFFSKGTGVFAPRATPETTPKKVKITNVTDRGFSVSFLTEEQTVGFVKYGQKPGELKLQAVDDRDQISGTVQEYQLHHISVNGLEAAQSYYFVVGTGSGSTFDNNGSEFTIKTAARGSTSPVAKTIYGNVTTPTGSPANGAITYVNLEGAGEMSSLVKDSGSWAIPLSNARTKDGSDYATITDDSAILITLQGPDLSPVTELTTTLGAYEMGSTLALGQGKISSDQVAGNLESQDNELKLGDKESDTTQTATTSNQLESTISADLNQETSTTSANLDNILSPLDATAAGGLTELLGEDNTNQEAVVMVDLASSKEQTVTTSTPVIRGRAAPNVVVKITVNSDSHVQDEVVADGDGTFALDLNGLSEGLEAGEHVVEYTYVDPDTGQEVTKTHVFTVAAGATGSGGQIAQANITPSPTPVSYGTENPYSPSPAGTASSSAGASSSAAASGSAKGGVSTPSSLPATDSPVPVSGSVGATMALVFGGLFFIVSGLWSFWIALELNKDR